MYVMRTRSQLRADVCFKLAAICVATGGLVAFTASAAQAQVDLITNRTFELLFIERQSPITGGLPPAAIAGVPPGGQIKAIGQPNRIAMYFRPDQQVDYERERNPASINATLHSFRGSTGRLGEWLKVANPYSSNITVRISTRANTILAEIHGRNFTQAIKVSTDGVNCRADISYRLDAGQQYFKLVNMKSKQETRHLSLAADQIQCKLGSSNIF
jgi:hypothetical protein